MFRSNWIFAPESDMVDPDIYDQKIYIIWYVKMHHEWIFESEKYIKN